MNITGVLIYEGLYQSPPLNLSETNAASNESNALKVTLFKMKTVSIASATAIPLLRTIQWKVNGKFEVGNIWSEPMSPTAPVAIISLMAASSVRIHLGCG